MKAPFIIIACVALSSCGIPTRFGVTYTDPDSGLVVDGSYSSKGGIAVEVSK